MSVGRLINRPRRSRVETQANDIMASVRQTVTILRSFIWLWFWAVQINTIIFSVHGHVFESIMLSGVNRTNTCKNPSQKEQLEKVWKYDKPDDLGYNLRLEKTRALGTSMFSCRIQVGQAIVTYWALAKNLHLSQQKVNDLWSSVLFTKVDSCGPLAPMRKKK